MTKKNTSTIERMLMIGVSLLGLAFLIAATITFVRSFWLEPTSVADTIDMRLTQQATLSQSSTLFPDDAIAPGAATAIAPPQNVAPSAGTASTLDLTVVSVVGDTPTAMPSGAPLVGPTATSPPEAAGTPPPSGVITVTPSPLPTATPAVVNTAPPTATPTFSTVINAGAQPGPSPTWSVYDIPTPLPASGPTKLSLHVQLNSGGVLDYVAAVHPPLIKSVEDIGFLKEVKALSPGTITIGRYVVDNWQHTLGQGNPEEEARRFVADQLPRYETHQAYVDYWEGYNEVTFNIENSSNAEWFARFEAERACEMQRLGYRAAIGGFSTGTPEPDAFLMFLPAIEAGKRCGAILTLHEYGAPTYYLWWQQGIPSVEGQPHYSNRGPLAGRYRWLYEDILKPRGLVIPLAITEAGVDGLVANGLRPGPPARGWMDFADYWVAEGLTTDPQQFYIDQLIWYDSILRQDDYVIGATIFTIAGGCCPEWPTYEFASLIPALTEYALSLK